MVYNSDIQKFMQDAAAGDPYPEDHSTAYYVNAFIANRDYINSMVLTGMDHTMTEDWNRFLSVVQTDRGRFH